MKKLIVFIKRFGVGIACDLLFVIGAVLIAIGAWHIYPPAGEITGGVFCVLAAILTARAQENQSGGDVN